MHPFPRTRKQMVMNHRNMRGQNQVHRQELDRQTDRRTDGRIDGQTDGQSDSYIHPERRSQRVK